MHPGKLPDRWPSSFPGWIIEGLSACTRLPHGEGNSMGGLPLFRRLSACTGVPHRESNSMRWPSSSYFTSDLKSTRALIIRSYPSFFKEKITPLLSIAIVTGFAKNPASVCPSWESKAQRVLLLLAYGSAARLDICHLSRFSMEHHMRVSISAPGWVPVNPSQFTCHPPKLDLILLSRSWEVDLDPNYLLVGTYITLVPKPR